MSLFGKKKEIRFESITIDRQRDVFRALESRGWTLCSEPFKFDIERPTEKIRKDALNMAKDLKAELLVETWDQIYHNKPYKGLSYSAWRPMTQQEADRKRMEAQLKKRPDYSDSLGSVAIKPKVEVPEVNQDDLKAFETLVMEESHQDPEELHHPSKGSYSEEYSGSIKTIKADDPYHHRGESASSVLKEDNTISGGSGPLFEQSMEIELGVPDVEDPSGQIDAMALMMDAAGSEDKKKTESQEPDP